MRTTRLGVHTTEGAYRLCVTCGLGVLMCAATPALGRADDARALNVSSRLRRTTAAPTASTPLAPLAPLHMHAPAPVGAEASLGARLDDIGYAVFAPEGEPAPEAPAAATDAHAPAEHPPESSGGGDAELAKKLQNPVADLISVPLQFNYDEGFGPSDAGRFLLNIQPVIPFSLTEDWNLITRNIFPVLHMDSLAPTIDSESGIGDLLSSFFFSPKEPVGGWILGAGPVINFPTATSSLFGSGKYSAGPTLVALQQQHGWTYGILMNHLWSFAGQSGRDHVNATYLQPFVSYTFPTLTTLTANTESTYDWEASQWTVPINGQVAQLIKIGRLPVQLAIGGRYYAEAPADGPEWGVRFTVTFLFPR